MTAVITIITASTTPTEVGSSLPSMFAFTSSSSNLISSMSVLMVVMLFLISVSQAFHPVRVWLSKNDFSALLSV